METIKSSFQRLIGLSISN